MNEWINKTGQDAEWMNDWIDEILIELISENIA